MLIMDADEARKNDALRLRLAAILSGKGEGLDITSLYSADFASFESPLSLGIERKTFPNLVGSLSNGELDEQLSKQVSLYDVSVLLIEGWPIPGPSGKVPVWGSGKSFSYAWFVGACAGWFGRGVWPMFIEAEATALTIVELYRTFRKTEHRDTFTPKKVLPKLHKQSLIEQVVSCIPGIGPKRAKQFRGLSPEDVNGFSVEHWSELLSSKALGRRAYDAWHS